MRHGINLSRLTYYGAQMFINRVKQSGTFSVNKEDQNGSLALEVEDGPAVIVAGKGSVSSLQLKGFGLKITDLALTEMWPRDIAVVRKDELPLYKAGQVFRTPLLNRLRGFACIRFMDAMQTNANRTGKYVAPLDARTYMDAMPVEVMASLCNTVGADAWINIPINMSDEDALALVRQFRAALHPALALYVELSNEVWNASFWAYRYAAEQGAAFPAVKGINPGQRWYGYRCAQVAKLISGAGIRFVMGTQTMNSGLATSVLKGFDEAGGDNATVHAWIVDGYVSGGIKSADLRTFAAANDLDSVFDRLMNHSGKGAIARGKVYQKHAAIAKTRGWALVSYEANLSVIPKGGRDAAEKALMLSFVKSVYADPRAKEIARVNLTGLKEAGCELVCHFNLTHKPSESGVWGLFEDLDDAVGKPWIQAAREV